MASVSLTNALRLEYETLFNSCDVRPERAAEVEQLVSALLKNRARYEAAGGLAGVPWQFVAVIHNMESSQNFRSHLHNGDPLTARTVHVPAGRPPGGNPPFTWEESAADALGVQKLSAGTDWTLPGMLYQIERYNGFGYRTRHPEVLSPYLWCFSNHYRSGKFVADGTFSDTAVSRQCGAAVLLRRFAEHNVIDFPDQQPPAAALLRHANRKSTDPVEVARAEALQRWLNTFPGIFVKVDGVPGDKTSDAFRAVTGTFLPGDPRAA